MWSQSFPLLPKAVFAFSLAGCQGCRESGASTRSRLRLRLAGDKAEKNPPPLPSAMGLRRRVVAWVQVVTLIRSPGRVERGARQSYPSWTPFSAVKSLSLFCHLYLGENNCLPPGFLWGHRAPSLLGVWGQGRCCRPEALVVLESLWVVHFTWLKDHWPNPACHWCLQVHFNWTHPPIHLQLLWLPSHHRAVLASSNRDSMVCKARVTDYLALYRSLLTPEPS